MHSVTQTQLKRKKRLSNSSFQSKISSASRIKIAITVIYIPTEIIKLILNSLLFFKLTLISAHALRICLYFSDLQSKKFNHFQKQKHPCQRTIILKVLSTKKQYLLSSILTHFWLARMNEMTQNKDILRKITTGIHSYSCI